MTSEIYNVQLVSPSSDLYIWTELGASVGANPKFNALTLKALYITGLVLALCRSVNLLLSKDYLISTTYYPAYAVFASTIDLLGRCLRGNGKTKQSMQDITEGFKWLANPNFDAYGAIPKDHILVKTILYDYTIEDLVNLRNFAAHGQGANKAKIQDFDYFVLSKMPPIIGSAVQYYLHELTLNEMLAANLAKALVTPYRNRPVFDALWGFQATMDLFPMHVGQSLYNLDWSYKW